MSSRMFAQSGRLTIGGVICNPDGTIKQKLTLDASVPDTSRRLFPFPCTLQHENDARDILADALCNLFDVGSIEPQGYFKLFTEGGITHLSTVPMAQPAFDASVTGVATGLVMPWVDYNAAGSGLADMFIGYDRDNKVILTGGVNTSGEEMSFPQLEIAVNDIVKLLSVSYTAPP